MEQPVKVLARLLGEEDGRWAEIAALIYGPRYHQVLELWYCQIHAPELIAEDTFVMASEPYRSIAKSLKFTKGLKGGLVELSELEEFEIFDLGPLYQTSAPHTAN